MKLFQILPVVLSTFLIAGCGEDGPEKVAVSGNVAIDGNPVFQGTIAFVSLDGSRTAAGPIINGTYDISPGDGPLVGKQKVTIQAFERTGKVLEVKKSLPGPPDEEAAIPEGGIKIEETTQVLPERYNSKSELTATLASGENSGVDFDLTLAE